jgi:hypothetical protein
MKLVMTMVVQGRDPADLVDANLAFHLNAGVDFVVAADPESGEGTSEILELYRDEGYLHRLPSAAPAAESSSTEMARLAVARYDADWVISSDADQFWWPRGESLKDVLGVIPARYAIVQALVRSFVGQGRDGRCSVDSMTARRSLLRSVESVGEPPHPPDYWLRPVYRAEPNLVIDPRDATLGGRRVPLRAWYPIEVFQFPASGPGTLDDALLEDGLADGTLVVDTRLRDALRSLREAVGGGGSFALPEAGRSHIRLPVPTIVDDASYAVECAAVGEVDLVRLDRSIRELEQRIATLEARLWPRVLRTLSRVVRR